MKVLAIRHVRAEHLGLLEKVLKNMSMQIFYVDTAEGQRVQGDLSEYSMVVVLGGYMGAYEEDLYPFLSYEMRLMERALKEDVPLLGICLGSQMLAKVLGGKVYKGDRGKEIGWYRVHKVGHHPYFQHFPQEMVVFQWHGDTFDLPEGAHLIYSSDLYPHQAFVYGRAVGLQFHLEVDIPMVREWVSLYKDELVQEGVDASSLIQVDEEIIKTNTYLAESLIRELLGVPHGGCNGSG
ncbi:glutamine amidotransferase class-I [Thermocrinis albus DSM 14484]|uniref:Glutamine amidotransferase class-I n=1 Tax=Thermocrinis albus (strain DSM 14484 / JCM 11386 / HI 11/12) TaxID=638303 RepID=D3SMH8_THEAH|nr:GMP synthase [Thermocrinis albus]ADC89958.1 glutamine amidotransferase class-I [Thermocrinis albus DSM 14484]